MQDQFDALDRATDCIVDELEGLLVALRPLLAIGASFDSRDLFVHEITLTCERSDHRNPMIDLRSILRTG